MHNYLTISRYIVAEVNDGFSCITNNYNSEVANKTFQTNEVARLNSSYVWVVVANNEAINVLQFDENDETTTTVEEITYNQALKLEDDTVKVKIWANDILLKNDEIITTYRIGEESFEYEAWGEVVEFEIEEDDTQMLGAIRGRKNINFIVMKVS